MFYGLLHCGKTCSWKLDLRSKGFYYNLNRTYHCSSLSMLFTSIKCTSTWFDAIFLYHLCLSYSGSELLSIWLVHKINGCVNVYQLVGSKLCNYLDLVCFKLFIMVEEQCACKGRRFMPYCMLKCRYVLVYHQNRQTWMNFSSGMNYMVKVDQGRRNLSAISCRDILTV